MCITCFDLYLDFKILWPSRQEISNLLIVSLSIYLSICLYVYTSTCLPVYLSIRLSACLSVYLSIYLYRIGGWGGGAQRQPPGNTYCITSLVTLSSEQLKLSFVAKDSKNVHLYEAFYQNKKHVRQGKFLWK